MSYTFNVSIAKEGKWFVARAIELDVVSQGRTAAQAKKNLTEAVSLYLEDEPAIKRSISKQAPRLTQIKVKA